MFRDEKKPTHKQSINVLIRDGGVGDMICTIPALKQLVETQTWINPLIWVPDYMLDFTKHFLPATTVVRDYSEAKKKFDDNLTGVTTKWLANRTAMRTHPVDYAYQCLLDKLPYTNDERSYPNIDRSKLQKEIQSLWNGYDRPLVPYVVIVGTATEIVKTMPVSTMNQIIDYIRLIKGYEIIFVGQDKVSNGIRTADATRLKDIQWKAGVNLINRTNLLELALIMEDAELVIGMDGGPIHVAGFTKTPIVTGYTFASPDHLMPIRDGIPGKNVHAVVPDSSLGCKFCQTNWPLLYGHDFRNCYYDDFACTKQMTFEKFREGIDKFI